MYLPLVLLVFFLIVLVTTMTTTMFPCLILKKNHKWLKQVLRAENLQVQKDIHYEIMRIGTENVPSKLAVSFFVLNLSNNVLNPLIQAYFIKDLVAAFKTFHIYLYQKCAGITRKWCKMKNHEGAIDTNDGNMKTNYCLMKKWLSFNLSKVLFSPAATIVL